MESFITDFLKVYNNLVDAYNAKILETINDKYRIIDRAMIASYL
jgi:flagellar capping protein FliD